MATIKDPILEQKIMDMYNSVPEYTKEDIGEAYKWAKHTLTQHEGAGHDIRVYGAYNLVECSFAKPSWAGDHCGRGMEHGAEAIVMAVCEYMCGA